MAPKSYTFDLIIIEYLQAAASIAAIIRNTVIIIALSFLLVGNISPMIARAQAVVESMYCAHSDAQWLQTQLQLMQSSQVAIPTSRRV